MDYRAQVVCIDDEAGIIDLVTLILKSENIKVTGAKNGPQGLEKIREILPDVVLLDVMMPGMDGWEVYKEIRTDEALKDIPVVIVTARNSSFEEIIARARAGVDDYMTKPFQPEKLRAIIKKVMGEDDG